MWWTCHSEDVSTGLSRTGIITNICNLLPIYIQLNIYDKVRHHALIILCGHYVVAIARVSGIYMAVN